MASTLEASDAVPTPPHDMYFVEAIAPSIKLLLVGTVCSSALIPIAVLLFHFSTSASRRRPLFIFNALLVSLGLVEGVINFHIQTRYMHNVPVPPRFEALFATLVVLVPMLADAVLLLRVVAVHPPRCLCATRLIIIYGPVGVVKVARTVVGTLFIVTWTRAIAQQHANPLQAGQDAWDTPFPKIAWLLQLSDSTLTSMLFLTQVSRHTTNRLCKCKSSGRDQDSEEVDVSGWPDRLRTLFWIAASNFVFPVAFDLAQLPLAFRDPSFLDGALVLIVNDYVEIVGVLLATIWSTGTAYSEAIPGYLPEAGNPEPSLSSSMRFVSSGFDEECVESPYDTHSDPSGSLQTASTLT